MIAKWMKSILGVAFVSAAFLASSANATIVGDAYTADGTNFPVDFANAGPLTFNALGDTSVEVAGGALLVTEQYFDLGGGTGVLGFQTQFVRLPVDPFASFSFSFSDLDFGDAFSREVTTATLAIDFGVSQLLTTNVLPFVTSSFSDGLNVSFSSPASWNAIFQSTNPNGPPTKFQTTFLVGVQQGAAIPAPSVILLLMTGAGMLLASRWRVRA